MRRRRPPPGWRGRLRGVVRLPALADSALVVRDGQTGDVLFDDNGSQLRIPASTTKILSAAAVGQAFAADATLETVVRRGDSDGEIVLVAGGDSLINPGKGDAERHRRASRPRRPVRPGGRGTAAGRRRRRHPHGRRVLRLRPDGGADVGPSFRPSGITGCRGDARPLEPAGHRRPGRPGRSGCGRSRPLRRASSRAAASTSPSAAGTARPVTPRRHAERDPERDAERDPHATPTGGPTPTARAATERARDGARTHRLRPGA